MLDYKLLATQVTKHVVLNIQKTLAATIQNSLMHVQVKVAQNPKRLDEKQ